jgi:hypothetical protein
MKNEIKELRQNAANVLDYALMYAKKGFSIIPCHWIDNKKCSCGKSSCSSEGKHPITNLVPNGLKNASKDSEVIQKWFLSHPNANVAIVTGAISGISVLDFDLRDNGLCLFNELREEHFFIQSSLMANSGGGGIHSFLKYNSLLQTRVNVLPGMDTRNDGGYILVEPSTHISGGEYRWIL